MCTVTAAQEIWPINETGHAAKLVEDQVPKQLPSTTPTQSLPATTILFDQYCFQRPLRKFQPTAL